MAVRNASLTTQFVNKLKDENVPLAKKYEICLVVFTSSSIPILQKEDHIFDYLTSQLQADVSAEEKIETLKCLKECLTCQHMQEFSGNIRPGVVDGLFQLLGNVFSHPEEARELVSECIVDLLSIKFFQRWVSYDVSALCKLIGGYFSGVSPGMYSQCIKIISLFLYINKISLMKEEMRTHFISETLLPLCYAHSIAKDDDYNSFRTKAVSCITQILFYDPSFISSFCTIIKFSKFEGTDSSKDMKSFCEIIKNLPTNSNLKTVSSCFTLFLRAVIQKLKPDDKFEDIFRTFNLLCGPLGLHVDKVRSISMSPVKKWSHENSFVVIGDMIAVLDDCDIPLNIDLEEYTLQTWMISLVIGMSGINTDLKPEVLVMIKNAFLFNNLIIEPCIRTISSVMLKKKSESIKPYYIEMMKVVWEGSSKAQRFQKIVSLFLSFIREILLVTTEDIFLEDVFPKEISQAFSQAILPLAHSQTLSVMKALLYHLEHDCLPNVQCGSTDVSVINTEIICEMLIQLLTVVKFSDHSVPDVIKAKFANLMEDLKNLLGKFGDAFIVFHHDSLIKAYLQLCYTFGAVKLLFDEYEGCPIKPLSATDLDPTNLSYVHPYINPEGWAKIMEKIVDHNNCLAGPSLNKLLVQKIIAVAQVEEGTEGPGTQAARLLLEISKTEWLWEELITLADLFQSKELVKLVKRMAHEAGKDQSKWFPLVAQENFQENRRLVLTTAFRIMFKAAKQMNDKNDSISYQALSYIHDDILVEYELSLLITDESEYEGDVVASIEAMVSVLENSLEVYVLENGFNQPPNKTIPHISFFEVLRKLPLHHFSIMTQSCIFLSILGLLQDIQPNKEVDKILFDIMTNILESNKKIGYKMFGGLNAGLLLTFLSERGKHYTGLKPLIRRICIFALTDKRTAKEVMKHVCEPNIENIWLTTTVIEALSQVKKKFINSEEVDDGSKPLNKAKCIDRLTSLCIPVLKTETPSVKLLPTFAVVLKHCILKEEKEELQSLLTHLEKYIEVALVDYENGIDLISHLLAHREELNTHFPNDIISKTWEHYLHGTEKPPDNIAQLLLTTSSTKQYKEMLTSLSNETKIKLNTPSDDPNRLDNLIALRNQLVTCHVSSEKNRHRQKHILNMVELFLEIVSSWPTSPVAVEAILHFFTTLANATSVEIKPAILDLNLLVLSSVPFPLDDNKQLLKNLNLSVEALFALYLFRTSLVLDRIPALLQRYRLYLRTLAPCGRADNGESIIFEAQACADKLERIATTMAKRPKYFSRVSPYIVADLIDIFEKHHLHPDVKLVYTNITNVFLSLCDTHAITYLEAVLPAPLFKPIYDNYKKYYKYIGKI